MNGSAGSDHPVAQPLAGRQRRLVLLLEIGVGLAAILAVAGLVLPGQAGRIAAQVFLGVLIATPLVRVAWLTVRWLNRRDIRFAIVGLGVLLVAMMAGLSAW